MRKLRAAARGSGANAFDGANQLVSSTTDGVTTKYAYDAAGRLVKEGNKTYRYGYLDKVMSVTEGDRTYTYTYHTDGQLASANYGGKAEDFLWDGLALIRRGDERFVNEPHIGGGNPVASSKGTTYFNDMLGTTVGAKNDTKYTPAALTAFGETIENGIVRSTPTPSTYTSFYTGKPHVAGLGHTFLFRNYRASLGKWQTADPMGYPDGWNQLAYCGNGVTGSVDLLGCKWSWYVFAAYYLRHASTNIVAGQLVANLLDGLMGTDEIDSDLTGYTGDLWLVIRNGIMLQVWDQINDSVRSAIKSSGKGSGQDSGVYPANGSKTSEYYPFVQAHWVFGFAKVETNSTYSYSWHTVYEDGASYIEYEWTSETSIWFTDDFHDAAAFGERFGREFENDLVVGTRYLITHTWSDISHKQRGVIE